MGQPARVGLARVGARSEAIASEAKQAAGINIQLVTKTFNFLVSEYTNTVPARPQEPQRLGRQQLRRPVSGLLPDQDGVLNHPGTLTTPAAGFNTGNYADPKANSLINSSVYGDNPNDVKNEAAYLEQQQPSSTARMRIG